MILNQSCFPAGGHSRILDPGADNSPFHSRHGLTKRNHFIPAPYYKGSRGLRQAYEGRRPRASHGATKNIQRRQRDLIDFVQSVGQYVPGARCRGTFLYVRMGGRPGRVATMPRSPPAGDLG